MLPTHQTYLVLKDCIDAKGETICKGDELRVLLPISNVNHITSSLGSYELTAQALGNSNFFRVLPDYFEDVLIEIKHPSHQNKGFRLSGDVIKDNLGQFYIEIEELFDKYRGRS